MFAPKTLLALFTAAAAVSARVVPRTSPPAGWWTEGLEDYTAYHTRYLALGCQNNHGTEFFDACCHPLKSDETLESARAPECVPSASASASACLAEPTSTVTTPDDESSASATVTAVTSGFDSSASLSTSSSASASATPVVNIATDGGDDDDTKECDADDDDAEDEDDEDAEDNDDEEDAEDCEAEGQDDGSDDEDDDTDDDEDCEDDGDDETTSVSSPVPTSIETSSPLPDSTIAPSSTFTEATFSSSSVFTAAPSSESVPSEPSSTFAEASSTEIPSAATPSSTSSSGGDVVTGGFATYYYQNGNAGACGDKHSDSEFIGAIDSRRYGDTTRQSGLCGKQVKITNTNNNKSVVITLADACPTCVNENCIDLSTGAFNQIAEESEGQVPIDWEFV